MRSLPVIGVSGSIDAKERKQYILRAYMKSVLKAGAIPVLLSMDMDEKQITACLERLDGLMLSGGNDMDPTVFGESPVPTLKQVNPLRDRFELRLIRAAYGLSMPVFAICRGVQTLNVALGGTLYQDLPTQYTAPNGDGAILHTQKSQAHHPSHRVNLAEGSPLRALYGAESVMVNSMHHQAIKKLAPPLTVCATAEDGVIEAVCDASRAFVWGVQWHPERMEKGGPLFGAFANACAEYAQTKEANL